MSSDLRLEKLHAAVQEYVNSDGDAPLVLTDFAVVYAAIDMHTADSEATVGFSTNGPRHSSLGLAHILMDGLTEGDDDE